MGNFILETRSIDFTYLDGTKALNQLSLKVPQGKKIAVLGNNGAGKTTLFLHFNGVNRPDRGEIIYKGSPLLYDNVHLKRIRKEIGIVFQNPDNQLFSASVYQDVSFGPLNLGWPEDKVREYIKRAMERVGVWDLREKPVHFLSHGQKKRVAMAGVLAMEPEVIILDEPTAGLDPLYSRKMLELLEEFNQNGATVVISSHQIDEVYAWADYVFVLHDGQSIAEGTPVEIFSQPEILEKAYLIKPWVLEMYEALTVHKYIKAQAKVPRQGKELLSILKKI